MKTSIKLLATCLGVVTLIVACLLITDILVIKSYPSISFWFTPDFGYPGVNVTIKATFVDTKPFVGTLRINADSKLVTNTTTKCLKKTDSTYRAVINVTYRVTIVADLNVYADLAEINGTKTEAYLLIPVFNVTPITSCSKESTSRSSSGSNTASKSSTTHSESSSSNPSNTSYTYTSSSRTSSTTYSSASMSSSRNLFKQVAEFIASHIWLVIAVLILLLLLRLVLGVTHRVEIQY